MPVPVLIVSPNPGFGELIRQSLQEAGPYDPLVFSTSVDALEYAQENSFSVCILDADIQDVPAVDLWQLLKVGHPEAKLILIPPEVSLPKVQMADLAPDGFLDTPFYLPNLIPTLEAVLGVTSPDDKETEEVQGITPKSPPRAPAPPPWLEDVERAAQHLTRLSLESSAEAALITRHGQVWAYAGELPQTAAQELAQVVAADWSDKLEGDLARFVRLEATGGEFMLYATALAGDLALALVFDARTPFSIIRKQAGNLAHALANLPNGEGAISQSPGEGEPVPGEVTQPEPSITSFLGDVPPSAPAHPSIEALPSDAPPSLEDESLVSQLVDVFLEAESGGFQGQEEPSIDLAKSGKEVRSGLTEPESPVQETRPVTWQPEYPSPSRSEIQMAPSPEPPKPSPSGSSPPVVTRLNYTCVLIPRFPQHLIGSDLADRLTGWVPQICLAFGWRLVALTIRSDYLQWIIDASPDASPLVIIDTMRRITSQRIFDEFGSLKHLNPSGDFWAPAFVLLSGSQGLTDQMIRDFIQSTRAWQGVSERG